MELKRLFFFHGYGKFYKWSLLIINKDHFKNSAKGAIQNGLFHLIYIIIIFVSSITIILKKYFIRLQLYFYYNVF